MSKKLSSMLVVALLVSALGVLGVSPSFAAAAGGTGPENALPIPSTPQTIAVGQRVWYAFQYGGDGSQILVDMSAVPGGSANFSVWTPDDVQSWADGNKENPVGRGAESNYYNGDLVWTGFFNIAHTYYVVVDQTGPAASTINLKVTGTDVLTPMPATTTASTTTSAPAASAAAPAAKAAAGGTGPENALPVPSTSQTIAAGQRVWYAFQYGGDSSQITVEMTAAPGGSANFSVWTPDDVQSWANGNKENPIGRGSDDTYDNSDLVWTGFFNVAHTYYVVVDQAGPVPSTINLKVTGTDVLSASK